MTREQRQDIEELVRGVLQSDPQAFERLVEQSHRVVRKIAAPLLAPHLIDDALQETYLTVYQKLHHLRDPGAFLGWLSRIALNVCYKLRKRQLPKAELSEQSQAAGPNVDVMMEIREALSELSSKERNAVILREFIGLSYEEISLAVSAPVGTVRSRLHKAREKLQDKI